MGIDRSRSITPFFSSCASAIAVANEPNATVWPIIPGIRKST